MKLITFHSQNISNIFKKKLVLIIAIFFSLILPASGFAIIKFLESRPASALQQNIVSPLSSSQPKAKNTQEEQLDTVYNLDYYLHLSKSFLAKATRMANDLPNQTEIDKVKIVNTLNEALKAANDAINFYPNQPEGYFVRAQVYQKVKHIWPELEKKAENDINLAKKLMDKDQAANVPLEKEAQPINFIPTQKANLAANITIAEPNTNTLPEDNSQQTDTNADSGTAILEAGQKELTINTAQADNTSQVYVVAKGSSNHTLTVTAKKQGKWFKVASDSAPEQDLVFKWWIIKE